MDKQEKANESDNEGRVFMFFRRSGIFEFRTKAHIGKARASESGAKAFGGNARNIKGEACTCNPRGEGTAVPRRVFRDRLLKKC